MKKLTLDIKKITVLKTIESLFVKVHFFDSIEDDDNHITLTETWNGTVDVEIDLLENKAFLIGDLEIRGLLNDIKGNYKRNKELGELRSPRTFRKFIIHEIRLLKDEFDQIVSENCFEETWNIHGDACSTENRERRRRLSAQELQDLHQVRG